MGNEFRVRKGLIVNGSGSVLLDVQGSLGQLFSVTDSLSGSLFSVNDISGVPVFEAFSDDTVKMGTFNQEGLVVSGSEVTINTGSVSDTLTVNNTLTGVDAGFSSNVDIGGSLTVTGSSVLIGDVGVNTDSPLNTVDINGTFRVRAGGSKDFTIIASPNDVNTKRLKVDKSWIDLQYGGDINIGGLLGISSINDKVINLGNGREIQSEFGDSTVVTRPVIKSNLDGGDVSILGGDTNHTDTGVVGGNVYIGGGYASNTDSYGDVLLQPSGGAVGVRTVDPEGYDVNVNGTVNIKNTLTGIDASFSDTLTINGTQLFNLGGEQTLDTGSDVRFNNQNLSGILAVTGSSTFLSNVTAHEDVTADVFNSGFGGNGWKIDANANAEFQDLTVRGTFNVYELLVRQLRGTNGSILVSNGGKVDTASVVSGSQYYITFDTGSSYGHSFQQNDIVMAQRLAANGTSLIRSFLSVDSVVNNGAVSASVLSGDTPTEGYEYLRIGNSSDTNRQGHIYLTADDSNSPFIGVRDGVDQYTDFTSGTGSVEKVRVGRLDGVTSANFGTLNGYGLWASGSVYLEGGINATFGDIGGFDISSDAISGGNFFLSGSSTGNQTFINSNDNFIVTADGDVTGSSVLFDGGEIGGFELGSSIISSSNGNIVLNANGQLTASDALLSGKITASTGSIGGFDITSTELTATNIRLDSTDAVLSLGTGTDSYNTSNRVYIDGDNARMSIGTGFKYSGDTLTIDGSANIANWTVATNTLTGGQITLDSTGTISISSSVWQEQGIQLNYDGSAGARIYAGNSGSTASDRFFQYTGNDFEFSATNASLIGGTFSASNAYFSGNVEAQTGTIGGFNIGSNLSNSAGSTLILKGSSGQITASAADIEGKITANTGTIGGFNIGSDLNSTGGTLTLKGSSGQITGSNVLFDGGVIGGFELGSSIISSSNGNIVLNANGQLTASDAQLTGEVNANSGTIGGFNIGSDLSNSAGSTLILKGSSGQLTASDADIEGKITANTGTIGGFNIGSNLSNSAGSTLILKGSSGQLTASNADITGTISAGSGDVGNWSIGTNTISAGSITLDSSTPKITVGTVFDANANTNIVNLAGWTASGSVLKAYDVNNAGFSLDSSTQQISMYRDNKEETLQINPNANVPTSVNTSDSFTSVASASLSLSSPDSTTTDSGTASTSQIDLSTNGDDGYPLFISFDFDMTVTGPNTSNSPYSNSYTISVQGYNGTSWEDIDVAFSGQSQTTDVSKSYPTTSLNVFGYSDVRVLIDASVSNLTVDYKVSNVTVDQYQPIITLNSKGLFITTSPNTVSSLGSSDGSTETNSVEWGNIGGTLSNQTDLQNALDGKADNFSNRSVLDGISSTDTSNWNTAYNKYVTGISGGGNSSITLTKNDTTTISVNTSHNHDSLYDDYSYWEVFTDDDDTTGLQVQTQDHLTFSGGSDISVTRGGTSTITIDVSTTIPTSMNDLDDMDRSNIADNELMAWNNSNTSLERAASLTWDGTDLRGANSKIFAYEQWVGNNFDNYDYFTLSANATDGAATGSTISSQGDIRFDQGASMNVTRNGNTITISTDAAPQDLSWDSGSNTVTINNGTDATIDGFNNDVHFDSFVDLKNSSNLMRMFVGNDYWNWEIDGNKDLELFFTSASVPSTTRAFSVDASTQAVHFASLPDVNGNNLATENWVGSNYVSDNTFNNHVNDTTNPHSVTASQLGLNQPWKFRGSYTNNTDLNNFQQSGDLINTTGNGSGNSNFPNGYGIIAIFGNDDSTYGQGQLSFGSDSTLQYRVQWNGWRSWRTLLHDGLSGFNINLNELEIEDRSGNGVSLNATANYLLLQRDEALPIEIWGSSVQLRSETSFMPDGSNTSGFWGSSGTLCVGGSSILDSASALEVNGYLSLKGADGSFPSFKRPAIMRSDSSGTYPFDDYDRMLFHVSSSPADPKYIFSVGGSHNFQINDHGIDINSSDYGNTHIPHSSGDIYLSYSSSGTINFRTYDSTNGYNTVATLDNSGNFNGNNFILNSDKRLKNNPDQIVNARHKINQLFGYTYDMKGNREAGIYAQDLNKVLPEGVVKQNNGYLGIKNSAVNGLLIEGFKEVDSEVEQLRNKVEKLEKQIKELKGEL